MKHLLGKELKMSYTALYRKFRPKTFDEMVGQEHITKTLKNQIVAGRVGHAYLFNGGRGTGKTSAAKILARAINCLNPKDGEPCNECEICKSILSGANTDVVEMDAASNNSVEDIRTIREEVNFLPTSSKYRVYIIDEVHMLSTGAFNALLKTLEEPPEHVKFILATTEPQKLPATILSRCQRFDFKRISNQDIVKRLKQVCKESNIEITEGALNTIAVLSEGAMRDALSILERCIQDGIQNVNEDDIKELVGIPKLTYIQEIVKGILNYNIDQVLATIDQIIAEGKDITNITWEMIKYVKDILIFKTTKHLDIYTTEEIKIIKELGDLVSKDRLLQLIYDLSELQNNIKTSSQKLIIFQAGLIKLCNQQAGNSNEDLERRIIELENIIKNGNFVPSSSVKNEKQEIQKQNKEQFDVGNDGHDIPKTSNVALKQKKNNIPPNIHMGSISKEWTNILNDLKENGKIMLYTNLINTTAVEINDMTVGIQFPNGINAFGKTVLEKLENKNELEKEVSKVSGKTMHIKYIDLKEAENQNKASSNSLEDMIEGLDIPFHVID